MKKAIVTGSTSMIGTALVKELLNNNFKVVSVVRPNSKNIYRLPSNPNLTIVEADLCNLKNLETIDGPCDVFYHLAWDGARKPNRDNESIQKNNYNATMKALQIAKKLGCKKFIGSGSQAEYGTKDGFEKETDECNPNTMYGKYKLKSCSDGKIFAENNDLNFIWSRIFSVYGNYDYNKTLIMHCINKLKKNEELDLTPCTQKWNFTYVNDIAKMLRLFNTYNVDSGIYNIANSEIKTLKDYVLNLKSILNSNSKINFGAIPYGNEGPVDLCPNVNKFLNLFPDFEFTNFENGIKNILKIEN